MRYLKRLTMGPLVLDEGLEKGQWRPLTEEELSRLRSRSGRVKRKSAKKLSEKMIKTAEKQ